MRGGRRWAGTQKNESSVDGAGKWQQRKLRSRWGPGTEGSGDPSQGGTVFVVVGRDCAGKVGCSLEGEPEGLDRKK